MTSTPSATAGINTAQASAATSSATIDPNFTEFTEQLDAININFNTATQKNELDKPAHEVKQGLRQLLKSQINFTNRVLNNAAESMNSTTIDRLAKIATAFHDSSDGYKESANRAVRILSNALDGAGEQNQFHISARLSEIDLPEAQDAVPKTPQYISPKKSDEGEHVRQILRDLAKSDLNPEA